MEGDADEVGFGDADRFWVGDANRNGIVIQVFIFTLVKIVITSSGTIFISVRVPKVKVVRVPKIEIVRVPHLNRPFRQS